eukprot:GFYU01001120.1.p1 GENE.GFYU01001120.1~~GFYU01001120.1.p1  ORF type:complete len:531 (-),score=120.25 GFYU01001120.1:249-1841(-)
MSQLYNNVVRLGGFFFGGQEDMPEVNAVEMHTNLVDPEQEQSDNFSFNNLSVNQRRALAVTDFETWASEHYRTVQTGVATPQPFDTASHRLSALTGRRRKPQLLLFFLRMSGFLNFRPTGKVCNWPLFAFLQKRQIVFAMFFLFETMPYFIYYAMADEGDPTPPVDDCISSILVIGCSYILMKKVLIALNNVYKTFTRFDATQTRAFSHSNASTMPPMERNRQSIVSNMSGDHSHGGNSSPRATRLSSSFQEELDNYTWFWSFIFLCLSFPVFFVGPMLKLIFSYSFTMCEPLSSNGIVAEVVWAIAGPLWAFYGSGMLTSLLVVFLAHLRELQLLRHYVEADSELADMAGPNLLERSKGYLKNHLESESRIAYSSENMQGMLIFLVFYAINRMAAAGFKIFLSTCQEDNLGVVLSALFYTVLAVIATAFAAHVTNCSDRNIELIHRKFVDCVLFATQAEPGSNLTVEEAYAHHSFVEAYKHSGGFKVLSIRVGFPAFLGLFLFATFVFSLYFKYLQISSQSDSSVFPAS